MLKMTIVGRVGKDAEVKSISPDKNVINFSVAHSEKFTDYKGEKKEVTIWVKCAYFRKPDQCKIAGWIKSGHVIAVEGKPDSEAWIDNVGNAKSAIKLIVTDVMLIGKTEKADGVSVESMFKDKEKPAAQEFKQDEEPDDLPF